MGPPEQWPSSVGWPALRQDASIRGLTNLVPKTALLEENGQSREVPAETLRVGVTILVRPGDRITADGQIIEGTSAIDESPVTGESLPKRKGQGDDVFAGTINTDAVLRVRVTAAAADNTIARVVKLVEEAQESKAPTERFIDRFSRIYTPGVLVVGALVAIVPPLLFGQSRNEWVYKVSRCCSSAARALWSFLPRPQSPPASRRVRDAGCS